MSKIANGWLLTLSTGEMLFSLESLLVTDKEGNYLFDGDKVYRVFLSIEGQGRNERRMQCTVIMPKASPERIANIIIPKHGIVKKEKIYEEGLIYPTIVKALIKDRSNIILPSSVNIPPDANVQKNPHQG